MDDRNELHADNVSVEFSGRQRLPALDNIDLTITRGDFVAVVGPSGVGKTTLLNVFAGFVRPTGGEARFRGKLITGPSAERGVVFQRHALLPWLDVAENIAFPLKLRGIGRRRRREMVEPLLARVGLADFADFPIWTLSGGMQQRVGLARALAGDPDLLLLDEPLGALDQITREELQSVLLELWAASGKTMLLITHDIEEALFLANRLVVLSGRPGRVVARRDLTFSRRVAAGLAEPRGIRADPEFVAAKTELRMLLDRTRDVAQPPRELAA